LCWVNVCDRTNQQWIGTSVSTVAITGAGTDAELLAATSEVFRSWTTTLSHLFEQGGLTKARARQLAKHATVSMEGAALLSRAQQAIDPFDDVAKYLTNSVKPS
jgi:TetR/AcrR family transcriptional regulator, lmrAB and yxaGH operons repressor